MIVKKVTLIKIYWNQKIKICMESEKVCHDMEKFKENSSFYNSFVRYFWKRDYFWIHMSSNYRSKAKSKPKFIKFSLTFCMSWHTFSLSLQIFFKIFIVWVQKILIKVTFFTIMKPLWKNRPLKCVKNVSW